MKIATYFIKLGGAALIALAGLIMFFLAIDLGGYSVFNALAIFGFGAFLVGHVLETSECPIKFTITKPQSTASTATTATTEVPAITAEIPAVNEEATNETTAE